MKVRAWFTRDKLRAFGIHLGISLFIFSVLLYLVLVHWYPQPLFTTDGGWRAIRIITAVDLVLGPLLTLIVYRRGKPGLKFDLATIACVQLAALAAGVWIVHSEHPAVVALVERELYTVPTYRLREAGVDPGTVGRRFHAGRPPLVVVDLPEDDEAYRMLLKRSVVEGRPLSTHADRYRDITPATLAVLRAAAVDVDQYLARWPRYRDRVEAFRRRHGPAADRFLYLELRSRYHWALAAFDPEARRIVDILDVPPPGQLENQRPATGTRSAARGDGGGQNG